MYYAKNIPENKKYEFFGFYSFAGKVTSFIGPVLFGTITYIFSSPKLGMASLLILFVLDLCYNLNHLIHINTHYSISAMSDLAVFVRHHYGIVEDSNLE